MATIQGRPFRWDEDIDRITQFLLDTYTLFGRVSNWDPRRWLGKIYHRNDADMEKSHQQLPQTVHIWEDELSQIVGVVIPESTGNAFLQIHPLYRHLEDEMLAWAEANLPRQTSDDGRSYLDCWAEEGDLQRSQVLRQRGYIRTDMYETMYRRSMIVSVPEYAAPQGYQLRNMRIDANDREQFATLLNLAFGRTIHSAEEIRNFQSMPYYREVFDIVVEAPDGSLAANAGFTVHEKESFALVEPVCTHPDHQGKGLSRVAIAEGLRRVQALGIATSYIGAWHSNETANYVYQKMGFRDGVRNYLWRRWG